MSKDSNGGGLSIIWIILIIIALNRGCDALTKSEEQEKQISDLKEKVEKMSNTKEKKKKKKPTVSEPVVIKPIESRPKEPDFGEYGKF